MGTAVANKKEGVGDFLRRLKVGLTKFGDEEGEGRQVSYLQGGG